MMRRILFLSAILALSLPFHGCEGGGNSGSETTNGLTGVVKDVEGRPIAGARVLLLPEDFNPAADDTGGFPLETRTDSKGTYKLADVAPGRYNLEFSDSSHGTLSLAQDVAVRTGGGLATLDGTLGMPGAIRVRIVDFLGEGEAGYVYIPGTNALLRVDSTARADGSVRIANVPVGRFPRLLLVVDAEADRKIITLARDFEVDAETTLATSPFQTWASSRNIPVNTEAMGVTGAVTDFPFLVRLNAANFDFSQARPNGQDVRFSKPDGSPIPYQIERWDASAKRAEIWTRLDTVAGSDSKQYITMHWGRGLTAPGEEDPSGLRVFGPEAGFATVYHLDEAANDDAGGYHDATPNANHATAASINPGALVPGIVAGAKAFAGGPLSTVGTLTAAMPKGFTGNTSYTVSFWIKYDTTATRQTILDFGEFATLKDVHFLIRPDTLTQFGAYDADRSTGFDPATWQNVFKLSGRAGKWTHIATVYNAAQSIITTYVNGTPADIVPTQALKLDGGALRIGKALATHPLDSPFNGALDEIRFCNRALSPDRIKLDYETQKP
ncbi:MAG: hypothetical protein JWP91_4320 [Fibrobacteres bacterium]|nr:hypothetical protein [Fibrobacterota bacterium]